MLVLFLFALLIGAGQSKSKNKPTSACSSASWSEADRQGILGVHNTLRSNISKGSYVAGEDKKPPAIDMELMTYDCELETSAQKWADTCPTGHSGTPGKGENIFWQWATYPMAVAGMGEKASSSWEDEFQQFGWPDNVLTMKMFNTGIGHATQMAWWSSNRIGCGIKIDCKSSDPRFGYEVVVICHYTPQGNILNQPVYDSGKTCSACRNGYKCDKKTGLCG